MPGSGIRYSESYAWHEAARWRGLSDAQMEAMDGDRQARVIAQWETALQIEAVTSWERVRRRR